MSLEWIGFIAILVINIVVIAYNYGKMNQKIKSMDDRLCNDLGHISKDLKEISQKQDEINERLSRLEGRSESSFKKV